MAQFLPSVGRDLSWRSPQSLWNSLSSVLRLTPPTTAVSERASIRVGEVPRDHPLPLRMGKPSTGMNRGSFTFLPRRGGQGSIISIGFRSQSVRVSGRPDNINPFITHACPLPRDFAVFLTIVCSILGAWPYGFHWPMEYWWA